MVDHDVTLKDVRIGFRNFRGAEQKYNQPGNRNFCIFMNSDVGHQLEDEGWAIKWLAPRDPDDLPTALLRVAVSWKSRPPEIYLVQSGPSKVKTKLDEASVGILDDIEIAKVDITIHPYNWEMANGTKGTKAYVKTMFVTMAYDPLKAEYEDGPQNDDAPF